MDMHRTGAFRILKNESLGTMLVEICFIYFLVVEDLLATRILLCDDSGSTVRFKVFNNRIQASLSQTWSQITQRPGLK